MRPVKPAFTRSLVAFAFLVSGCQETRRPDPAPADVVDECRYTLRRPERQRVRVWDGRFLEDEQISCFARSRCVIGSRHTRVFWSAPGQLVIEVKDKRWERPSPRLPPVEASAHNRLGNALIGRDAVATLGASVVEVLTADGDHRFPTPALLEGEAFSSPALVGDGIGLTLGEHDQRGLPVRPLLWLREPSRATGADAGPAPSSPLVHEGRIVGELTRTATGWHAALSSGWSASLPLAKASPPALLYGGDEVVSWDRHRLLAVARDGRRFTREIPLGHQVVASKEAVYLLGTSGALERVDASGAVPVIDRKPGHDLGGAALLAGSVVERVQLAVDERQRAAVIERVRLRGCRVEDRVHVVDLGSRQVTTLAKDDQVRLHPTFARGRLHFLEADSTYEAIGGAEAPRR